MSILTKLLAVQQALKAPKDQFNGFGKYSYRSCEGVLEALKPHLQANKMTVILSDTIKEIGGRVYVEATATATDVETGEGISVTAYAREEEVKKGMDASQVTGASSSYARKYALNGLFAIDDNKDSDVTNNGDNSSDKPKHGKSTGNTAKSQETALKCTECGRDIVEPKTKDGKPMSLEDYEAMCVKVYGRVICRDCRKKLAKDGTTS
jgi:hypothetical protein